MIHGYFIDDYCIGYSHRFKNDGIMIKINIYYVGSTITEKSYPNYVHRPCLLSNLNKYYGLNLYATR